MYIFVLIYTQKTMLHKRCWDSLIAGCIAHGTHSKFKDFKVTLGYKRRREKEREEKKKKVKENSPQWRAGKSSDELPGQYLPQAALSKAESDDDEHSYDFPQHYTLFIRFLSNSLLVVAIYDIFSGTGASLMCMLTQVSHAYWLFSFCVQVILNRYSNAYYFLYSALSFGPPLF